MKQIAEMLYKIYLSREGEHEIFEPENFDEHERRLVKSLSTEQHEAYLNLESDFYDIVLHHSVALLQYFLEKIVEEI